MESTAKRRLALLGGGGLLAATVATLAQIALVGEGVVAAEPYGVAIGVGLAMPMLLAGAYPQTEAAAGDDHPRSMLVLAESVVGVLAGVGLVTLLVAVDLPNVFPVGGGAAAAYLGAIAARAVVLGLFAASEE